MLAGISARAGGNLSGQQVHDWAIFVCCPNSAVAAEETCSRTLLAPEAERPVNQTCDKPLESYRHLGQLAPELCNHAVNHATAHQRFSHHDVLVPLRPVRQ
jgi:hypothetical protein